jgi:hypothetical protein
MLRKSILLVGLLGLVPLVAFGQELTAREYARVRGIPNRQRAVTLGPPHACTLSKQHPCIYYGGDIDPNDPQENGVSNENTLLVSESWTYHEVNVPVASVKIYAAFTNNTQSFGVIDPQTANWDFRVGLTEGTGGTSIRSGSGPAELTATGRNVFGLGEYELLVRTTVSLPKGNVWFDVQPNCTNPDDGSCSTGRYFESDTDGLNGINSKFTVTSNDGLGPVSHMGDGGWFSLCHDQGVACGDGMSAGLLK